MVVEVLSLEEGSLVSGRFKEAGEPDLEKLAFLGQEPLS